MLQLIVFVRSRVCTYITSIMVYGESSSCKLRLAEPLVPFICLVHLLRKGFMCRFWEHAATEGRRKSVDFLEILFHEMQVSQLTMLHQEEQLFLLVSDKKKKNYPNYEFYQIGLHSD